LIAAFLSFVFFAVLLMAVLAHRLPPIVAGWYAIASMATFAVYAADKSAARRSRPRISERMLHAWSLAGGWPGAAIAQSMLRHKSRKISFLAAFWATAVLNCGALVSLLFLFLS